MVRAAVRALDKAAQKGIVHRNAAARRKSRLMSRLHQLSVAATAPAAEAATPTKAPARRTAAKGSTSKSGTSRRTSGSTTTSRTRRASS
jgi:ribosomal S20-like protein